MGNVSHSKAKVITFTQNKSILACGQLEQTATIDKHGNFKIAFTVADLQKISLTIAEQSTSFFIQPGDSLTLKIDYLDFDKSQTFAGHNSGKNNFYKAFYDYFVLQHGQDVFTENKRRKAPSFANYIDSLYSEKIKFLDGYSDEVSEDFKRYFATSLQYEHATHKLNYSGFWAFLNQKKDTLPDLPASYFHFMKNLSVSSDTLIDIPEYFEYVKSAVTHYIVEIYSTSKVPLAPEEHLSIAKAIIKRERVFAAYKAHFIASMLLYEQFSAAEKVYVNYAETDGNTTYKSELKEIYDKVRKISPGQAAPDFTLLDNAGAKHSLSEYRGKIVYIDFWASWCGPCIEQLPHSRKLKEEFVGKDVVFLYISLDENSSDWTKAIARYSINGTNLNAPSFGNEVCKAYGITSLPTYFLIDKAGRIIDNNAPRPSSSEEIKKIITSAMEY